MVGVTAMRTGEGMTFTLSAQPTTRAVFTSVCRINLSYTHAAFLCLVFNTGANESALPKRHTTSERPSFELALLRLRDMQILKNKGSILGCPLDELFSCLLRESACAIALFTTKPFEK